MKKEIKTKSAPEPIGPYSQAVRSDELVFLSGQIAIDPETGDMIDGDIVAQTKQVMNNLKNVLKEADMDFSHVLKTDIFVKNIKDFAKVNEIYGSFFKSKSYPARASVETSSLPKDALVEIALVAKGERNE